MKFVDSIVQYCIKETYINSDQAPWLRYAIEKRFATLVVSIPFLIVGMLLSTPGAAIFFFGSFYFLRERVNGIHAKTVFHCLIFSLILDAIFLGIFFWYMGSVALLITSSISIVIILVLAPYNHPNIWLSPAELHISARKARFRLAIIVMMCPLLCIFKQFAIVRGLCLSIILTALLLIFAYIIKPGGTTNERK